MSTVRLPVPRPRASRPPRAGRGTFFIVVGAVLSVGLVALLGINTMLAQGSFALHELEAEAADLGARQATLEEEVADLAAPRRLADQARSIGMVHAENPAFLRLSDGSVIGEPGVAVAPAPPVVDKPETSSATAPAPPTPVVPDPAAPVDPAVPVDLAAPVVPADPAAEVPPPDAQAAPTP